MRFSTGEKPADNLRYWQVMWHHARIVAFMRTDWLKAAQRHFVILNQRKNHPALEVVTVWDINTTALAMKVASRIVAGKLAAAHGDFEGDLFPARR